MPPNPGPNPQKKFQRGAKPTPRHLLFKIKPFIAPPISVAEFAIVPKKLDTWNNAQYGDCVTAEEAYAIAHYSSQLGLEEIFVTAEEVVRWCRQHGYLNGAYLTEVMDTLQHQPLRTPVMECLCGDYSGVDYSDEELLAKAICVGPVKIAIDADALPPNAGNIQGWYALGDRRYQNTDHCVSLTGHGSAEFLYSKLGVPRPREVDARQEGYLLFTWGTVGFVTHPWLMGTCTEAYVRDPTTKNLPAPAPPAPPGPGPGPGPGPMPWPTLPPWLLIILRIACAGAPNLPPPYNAIAMAACMLLGRYDKDGKPLDCER